VFLSGQQVSGEEGRGRMAALVEKSLANLRTAAAGAAPLRLTCFVTSMDDARAVEGAMAAAFPGIPHSLAQTQRAPLQPLAECEAVGRLNDAVPGAFELVNPSGLPVSANYSQSARVSAPKIILTGGQLAFRYTEDDARLAFTRLNRTLEGAGSSTQKILFLSIYPLSPQIAETVRKVRFEFLNKQQPPASTLLPFEGLPSIDAAFGLEAVALAGN
jgi:enamine deaminase RidA (YjgF/YER057c/UK114 family)